VAISLPEIASLGVTAFALFAMTAEMGLLFGVPFIFSLSMWGQIVLQRAERSETQSKRMRCLN